MRTRTSWLALLLTVGAVLAPTLAKAQDLGRPDPQFWLPTSDRLERGGFYAAAEFMFMRMDNPLKHQPIAVRGILDFDGSITADLTGQLPLVGGLPPTIIPGTPRVGTFLGSGSFALFADDAGGPLSYQPGWRLTAGWKFRDQSAIEFSWLSLLDFKYNATATLVPPTLNAGAALVETFLFSPVFNFPNDFAGPREKIALGNPLAAYGIWNGASVMNISFVQRFSQYDIAGKVPMFDYEYCRTYGLIGPRHVSLWERFRWRTVAPDFSGTAAPEDVAQYINIVSNQMYGVFGGIGTELYLGKGFAVSLEGRVAVMVDFVREIAKYERADEVIANKRARREYAIVPELQGAATLWWYPAQGVQIKFGYEVMSFFNTIAAPEPVSFNYGGLDVDYKHVTRYFDGFHIGIGFIF